MPRSTWARLAVPVSSGVVAARARVATPPVTPYSTSLPGFISNNDTIAARNHEYAAGIGYTSYLKLLVNRQWIVVAPFRSLGDAKGMNNVILNSFRQRNIRKGRKAGLAAALARWPGLSTKKAGRLNFMEKL